MRILHLLGAEEDTGGILSTIRGLHTAAETRGCKHVVWVNQRYRETRRPMLEYRSSRRLLAESPNHLELMLRAPRALVELKSLVRSESFDVLHAHSRGALPVAAGVALLWRRPVLFSNHAYARRIGMYRWAAGLSRMHTSVLTPNMARHYGLSVPGPRLAVVSECCADELFLTPIESRGRRSNEGAIRLVGLGNIVRWKNWHLLLEAIARLPESSRRRIEFHHWGPTPNDPDSLAYERELRDYVRASGLDRNCHFRGVSLRVAEVLRDADWFVLPSTNEPCSVALIEALACGVPAVVSASGGNVDIIRPNATGLLFAPDSSPDLAAKLDNILEGRARMAAPAELRESVRQRSASAVADQFLTIYRRIQWN